MAQTERRRRGRRSIGEKGNEEGEYWLFLPWANRACLCCCCSFSCLEQSIMRKENGEEEKARSAPAAGEDLLCSHTDLNMAIRLLTPRKNVYVHLC